MVFSSISFLYIFLPLFLILYFTLGLKVRQARNPIILAASLVFYAWGEPKFLFVMILGIIICYVSGRLLGAVNRNVIRKIILIMTLVVELGFLAYFKYVDFFIASFGQITGLDVKLLGVALPIGISFYTLQIVSYVIDVYRKDVEPQKNFFDLATYIAMFPQLIAGPIIRYSDIEKQLKNREISFEKVALGARRFILGLSKKVLIANALGAFNATFRASDNPSILFFWLNAIIYALHVYFDFSGYSDMAIGLGKILGFDFMENFNYPFISKSASEFWRRWHISLGSWLRDYVYIPLGGNRCSKLRWLLNIFIVWFLTGFWHGAAWNFILWGLFYGVFILIERPFIKKIPKAVGTIYQLLLSIVGFLIFGAESLSMIGADLVGLVGFVGVNRIPIANTESIYYLVSYAVVIGVAIIGATPLPKKVIEIVAGNKVGKKIIDILEPIVLIALLILVTAYLVDGSFNPFLYFRF